MSAYRDYPEPEEQQTTRHEDEPEAAAQNRPEPSNSDDTGLEPEKIDQSEEALTTPTDESPEPATPEAAENSEAEAAPALESPDAASSVERRPRDYPDAEQLAPETQSASEYPETPPEYQSPTDPVADSAPGAPPANPLPEIPVAAASAPNPPSSEGSSRVPNQGQPYATSVSRARAPQPAITSVRSITLLPQEKVTHSFTPLEGLTREIPSDGQLLITTNQRVISFSSSEGRDETILAPIEELKGIVLKGSSRSASSLFQTILLALGGFFVYFIVAYWITGEVSGPSVPIIGMDLGPLLVLLLVIWGVVLIGRFYLGKKEDGEITFQGSNWAFSFPYESEKAGADVYQVVNTVFTTRRSRNGDPYPWED